ncbi:MAG: dTMP kinase [Cyanobacteria bacterium J06560_2]
MKGKLIVFEGGEGCGKTTQVQQLYGWLKNSKTVNRLLSEEMIAGIKLTREPGGTAVGKKIRHLLLTPPDALDPEDAPILSKTELLLYAADRAQHVDEMLRPWLAAGYLILCDRYTDSTVAYQGYGRQLDLTLIDHLNQIATGGLKSDLTLWLNVSPSVGLNRMRDRGQADRIEQASQDFHQRVSAGFAALATDQSDGPGGMQANFMSSGPTVEIDGDRAIEDVSDDIQQVLEARLAQWYPEVASKL